MAMTGRTLTITAAARYLGVSRRTLYNWLKDGRFDAPPIEGSHPRRWNIEALDEWRGASSDAGEPV